MPSDVHLLVMPPATAPWARVSLRVAGRGCFAEVKTDWDVDEAVRRSRRGFFDSMVQAVKQLQTAKFDQASKAWEIGGGSSSIHQLLQNLSCLGFTVAEGPLKEFLARLQGDSARDGDAIHAYSPPKRPSNASSTPSVFLHEDKDDEIEELLASGWLDRAEAEVREECKVPSCSVTTPSQDSSPTPRVRVGEEVIIQAVRSHPQLNGRTGVVEAAEGERWRVAVDGTPYSLAAEKLHLQLRTSPSTSTSSKRPSDVHLLVTPPATAPWARVSLRVAGRGCFAEVKTDWDVDEAVRRSRRGFFDSMVQAVKQLQTAKFDQASKAWEIGGGSSSIHQLLQNLSCLGFTVAEGPLKEFLARLQGDSARDGDAIHAYSPPKRPSNASSTPSVFLHEDKDDEIEELLASGWLDRAEAEVREECKVPFCSVTTPSQDSSPTPRVRVGEEVIIQAVRSHPQLNGRTGVVEAAEGERWRVAVDGTPYSLAAEKLHLQPRTSPSTSTSSKRRRTRPPQPAEPQAPLLESTAAPEGEPATETATSAASSQSPSKAITLQHS